MRYRRLTTLCALAVAGAAAACSPAPRQAARAAAHVAALDVMNSKCLVMPGEQTGDDTVEYMGKIYHFCCSSCVEVFKKDPQKYVKAYDANPAGYDAK